MGSRKLGNMPIGKHPPPHPTPWKKILSENPHGKKPPPKKASYNHFHNNLRLFDVLSDFPFTTSKTMLDYYL